MSTPKTVVFADGENLVMRYQAMVANGAKPRKDVAHIQDTFVWHPGVTTWSCMDIQRVNYYTTVSGDQKKLAEIKSQIASTTYKFEYDADPDTPAAQMQLVPRVFHKESKSRKTRNVDISIVIDVMRVAHLTHTEQLILLTGDGDYLPLIEEVMRLGKTVWLCAFSSGLNEKLKSSVDLFESLDDIFFHTQQS